MIEFLREILAAVNLEDGVHFVRCYYWTSHICIFMLLKLGVSRRELLEVEERQIIDWIILGSE